MKTAHWIESGLSMPVNHFSFTAVFFSNQIEILHRLEGELNSRVQALNTSDVNIVSSPFQKDLTAILDLIKIRTDQLNGVVENYNDHELGITFYKASEQLLQCMTVVRKAASDAAVSAALHPELTGKWQAALRVKLNDVLISLKNFLKFSELIQTKADVEWIPG